MRRRGFVFPLDALLSLLLVMIFVMSIVAIEDNTQVYTTYMREQSKYIAEDTLTTLRTVSLKELVPPQKIEEWLADGTLNTTLVSPDMSPLEIVATYWATEPLYPSADLRHKAEVILGYILNNTLKGYNYELLINNYTSPYLRKIEANYLSTSDVSTATLTLSGYAYNQTPRGYMARAFLTKLGSKETEYTYVGMYYEAPGWTTTDYLTIKQPVPHDSILPSDVNITEVRWLPLPKWAEVTYHYTTYYTKMQLYIDGEGVTCGQFKANQWIDVKKWEILVDNDPNNPETCNMLEILLKHSNLKQHVFEIRVYNPAGEYNPMYTAGIVNNFISISYTTSSFTTFRYQKRFYFDNVTSYHLPLYLGRAIFIPGNLTYMKVQLTFKNFPSGVKPVLYVDGYYIGTGREISPGVFVWDNATISANANYSALSQTYPYIIVTAGSSLRNLDPPLQLDGENSYIEIDYIFNPVILTPYSIDLTKQVTSSDIMDSSNCKYNSTYEVTLCRDLTWGYVIPQRVSPVWTKFHFIILYNVDDLNTHMTVEISNPNITVTKIWDSSNSISFIGISPLTKDVNGNPIDPVFASGINYIHAYTDTAYEIAKELSSGEFTYIIQAYAGYGDVFPKLIRSGCNGYNITYYWGDSKNPNVGHVLAGNDPYCSVTVADLMTGRDTYAVDDAIIRLFNNLGGDGTSTNPLLIELPSDVNIEFASMGDIPGLLKPITITLRVWREQ
ncbi:hydrolase [Thermococcus sp. M39]|uniref:hydrolase n=1 Tax=Thermococcus sp. M39 TaxID=1638262 RepID=UPI00143C8206|nr:hydrolase [Thermococcus sp. M39]NJE08959.1 hydrolase [Thermococcus sp. M39]